MSLVAAHQRANVGSRPWLGPLCLFYSLRMHLALPFLIHTRVSSCTRLWGWNYLAIVGGTTTSHSMLSLNWFPFDLSLLHRVQVSGGRVAFLAAWV